jgi:hypothetical protein
LRAIRSKLTYSNVIASIAMFLALTGGTVMAAKLRSGDIAANAIKKKNLAKNSIVNADFRKKSLITQTATGAPVALNVAPTAPATAVSLPLSGKTTFTPKKGYIGELLAEAQFTLASAAPPGVSCTPTVRILVNGEPVIFLTGSDIPYNATTPPTGSTGAPYTSVVSGSAPIGVTGSNATFTADYTGDPGCTPTSKVDELKLAVLKVR